MREWPPCMIDNGKVVLRLTCVHGERWKSDRKNSHSEKSTILGRKENMATTFMTMSIMHSLNVLPPLRAVSVPPLRTEAIFGIVMVNSSRKSSLFCLNVLPLSRTFSVCPAEMSNVWCTLTHCGGFLNHTHDFLLVIAYFKGMFITINTCSIHNTF